MISLLHVLSYFGTLTAFLFVTLSLASGLLWIAELIEEHTRTARIIGVRAIYVIIVLHALLFITDGLPFLLIAFSILCHVVYLQHFSKSTWPFISLSSPVFALSCVLVVADHFLWFFHFTNVAQDAKRARAARYRYSQNSTKEPPTFMDVAAFFALCVWFIPLFLFLSLSANDNVIPSFGSSAPSSPMGSTVDLTSETLSLPKRRSGASSSLLKAVLAPIVAFVPRIGRKSRDGGGIIAPPTPGSISPLPSSQGYSPWGENPPAHSPVYPNVGLHTEHPGRLTPPPTRRMPSEPPRSRTSSQTSTGSVEKGGLEKNDVFSSSAAPGPRPAQRIAPSRSLTMPPGADFSNKKAD